MHGGRLVVHTNTDWRDSSGLQLQHHGCRCQIHENPVVSVADLKPDLTDLGGKSRMQPKLALASLQTGVAAQEQIDGTCHCAEVDTFLRRPPLDVCQMALQRLVEHRPRAGPVGPGQQPGTAFVETSVTPLKGAVGISQLSSRAFVRRQGLGSQVPWGSTRRQ